MQELEDAPLAIQIARMVEIIMMDNNAIKMHTKDNSPAMIVEQYVELRDEHLAELSELLKETGMTIQLAQMQNAA
jgi:hypothetical protein